MDTPSFNALKYGQILQMTGGEKIIIQHTVKDASGNTIAFGYLPAFDVTDAAGLTLLNSSYSRTLLQGAPDGSIIMMGQTVPGA